MDKMKKKMETMGQDTLASVTKLANSFLPLSLEEECNKCSEIVKKFKTTTNMVDEQLKSVTKEINKNETMAGVIPEDVIKNCKGIAIISIAKVGFGWSGRGGSGLVLSRLENGEWSAPSAIATGGVGFGFQIGAEVTDTVFFLNTREAVDAFFSPNLTLGGNCTVAAGPYGRSAEVAGEVGSKFAPIYSYSNSQGLFAGVSFEGSVIIEREAANAKFYAEKVSAKEILSGFIPKPAGAAELYKALDQHLKA
jgi:lipid-binding SYLF domain-containing protein